MPDQKIATVLAVLALLYFGPGLFFLGLTPGARGDQHPGSSATLTCSDEPGDALEVSGTVYGPDGRTPISGVELYVYHTDNAGYYSPGTNDNTNPRLKATLRTGADGGYAFRTIKPAPYPGGGVPAHIHYVVEGAGYPSQRRDLHFEGDPYLSERSREQARREDRFASVRPVAVGADGVSRVTFDLRLRE